MQLRFILLIFFYNRFNQVDETICRETEFKALEISNEEAMLDFDSIFPAFLCDSEVNTSLAMEGEGKSCVL